jgi:hypothetical protein
MREGRHRSGEAKSDLFLAAGLDDPNQFDLAGEIRFCAHATNGAASRDCARDGVKIGSDLPVGSGLR